MQFFNCQSFFTIRSASLVQAIMSQTFTQHVLRITLSSTTVVSQRLYHPRFSTRLIQIVSNTCNTNQFIGNRAPPLVFTLHIAQFPAITDQHCQLTAYSAYTFCFLESKSKVPPSTHLFHDFSFFHFLSSRLPVCSYLQNKRYELRDFFAAEHQNCFLIIKQKSKLHRWNMFQSLVCTLTAARSRLDRKRIKRFVRLHQQPLLCVQTVHGLLQCHYRPCYRFHRYLVL